MKEKRLDWYGRNDTITSKRPEPIAGTLVDGDWETMTVTTKPYRHFVWDDYAGNWYDPDDPYSNGMKTEKDFEKWHDNVYSDVTVRGGTVKFHRAE